MGPEKLILNIILEKKSSETLKDDFEYSKKVSLTDPLKINSILNSNLSLGDFLPAEYLGLNENYTYKITGASGLSGTPYKKFVNCHNPVLIHVRNKKKKIRVLPKFINYNCSALNLVAKIKTT